MKEKQSITILQKNRSSSCWILVPKRLVSDRVLPQSINYFANYRSIYLVNEYFVILASAKQADRLVKLWGHIASHIAFIEELALNIDNLAIRVRHHKNLSLNNAI